MRTTLVDIDGVVSLWNPVAWAIVCNESFDLGIQARVLKNIRSVKAFHELPEAQAYRMRVGDDQYSRRTEMMRFHPWYVKTCVPINGALNGVRYLSERGNLKFCSARFINFNTRWNNDLARSTVEWLASNNFPSAYDVIFCDKVIGKLTSIAGILQSYAHPILLVDDSPDLLVARYTELSREQQQVLSEHLTLAAFGYQEWEQDAPFPVIPFPGWHESHNLVVNQPIVTKEVFP